MANVRTLLEAIERAVDELLDLLRAPAGEFVPRARRICNELVDEVLRWRAELDREDEPTQPRMRIMSAPKPPPIPRKRQETMEIDLDKLDWTAEIKE